MHLHSLVQLNDRFALRSGLLEITYDTGAKVILQGPVTYKVDSAAGGYLAVGKLTARLEKKAEGGRRKAESLPSPAGTDLKGWSGRGAGGEGGSNLLVAASSHLSNQKSEILNHKLFAITTPTAVVTDLGTEFGVEVDRQGHTTSHVFRGTVRVQVLAADGKPIESGRVLHENDSVRIDRTNAQQTPRIRVVRSTMASAFVREIQKPVVKFFDLADVVAGGDGFSGHRGRGIAPATGLPTDSTLAEPRNDIDNCGRFRVTSDGKYHRVKGLSFVDGVFIPDGRPGGVQVDSGGHVVSEFSPKCNATAGNIWAGGVIPVLSSSMPPNVAALLPSLSSVQTLIPTKLGNIDYASKSHALIFLPANNGITFDLDAIRRANPGCKPVRFRATAGNTEIASEDGLAEVYADFWVLVDGQIRFRRREINKFTGVFPISLPIAKEDRFLTLVASDGGNDIGFDWILFGDPVLELLPAAPAGQTNPTPK